MIKVNGMWFLWHSFDLDLFTLQNNWTNPLAHYFITFFYLIILNYFYRDAATASEEKFLS